MFEDGSFILLLFGGVYVLGMVAFKVLEVRTRPAKTEPHRPNRHHHAVHRGEKIPREVQEEIDQTPEWWDREYQKLLRSLPGAEGPWDAENAYRALQRAEKEFYRRHRDHEISEDRTFSGVVARYCFDCARSEYEDEKRRALAPGGYVEHTPPTTAELRRGEYVLVGFNGKGEDVYDRVR